MIEVYKVFNDETHEHVANLYYNQETKEYSGKITSDNNCMMLFAGTEPRFHWRGCPNPPGWCIENWLKDRVIPENRQMLKEILLANGIHEYDWRVLIKLNHGRSVCDPYSVEVELVDKIEDTDNE